MLSRAIVIVVTVLACAGVAFGAYSLVGRGGRVEAARASHCTTKALTPPETEMTCTGQMVVATPFGKRAEPFTLVVDAIFRTPEHSSPGDRILACTLSVGGAVPRPVHSGPCP